MNTKEIKIKEAENHIQGMIEKATAKGNKPGMLKMIESYREALEILKNTDDSYFEGDNQYTDAATLLYINSNLE